MAKIKQVQCSFGYTVQPRQYEGARADFTVIVEVDEGESAEDAAIMAQNFVRTQVIASLRPSIAILTEDRQAAVLKQLETFTVEVTSIEEVTD